jgi:hypothetical protein
MRSRSGKPWARAALLCALLPAACGRQPDDETAADLAPPAAAELVPMQDNVPLDEKLARMDEELVVALRNDLRDDGVMSLYRAEAISDRLLETPPPFTWMKTSYLTEARLRQIQSLADRVIAQMRRQVDPALLRADVHQLRHEIGTLRSQMAAGGSTRPPSLDSLLAGYAADTLATPGEGSVD